MIERMFRLDGTVALVTGASRGLGRGFALTLAAAGAKVALAARDSGRLADLAAEIAAAGGDALAVELDVTSRASIARAMDEAEAGLGPLGVVVNNAGIAITRRLLEVSEADWQPVIDTNLTGAFFVAQEAARRMAERGRGSIVNIASLLGLRTISGVIAYSAAKAGLIQVTRTMAMELARRGVRVNALAPGYFETDLNRDFFASPAGQQMIQRIPERRPGRGGDLDGPLLFLASDASRYVTGQVLAVDGGHTVAAV